MKNDREKDAGIYGHLLNSAERGLKVFIVGALLVAFGAGVLLASMFFLAS